MVIYITKNLPIGNYIQGNSSSKGRKGASRSFSGGSCNYNYLYFYGIAKFTNNPIKL